jgi:colanic acid biosynthesis glycosyl transferase WcaI
VKVAVVTHFFPPEPGAGALRVASLVDALAAAGNDVTVVTNFPSFPRGRFSEARRPFARTERAGRVRVLRLFSLLVPGLPGSRLLHWLSAAASASGYLLTSRERYDAVIVSSPPITVAIAGLIGAWRHRSRFIVELRDVWPDIAVAMGIWKSDGFLARAVEWFVRRVYRRADLVVVVTPTALAQVAQRGVDPSRLLLARNAAERAPNVSPRPRQPDGFTAIYAGNLGLTTDVDVLVDAAALLAQDGITIEIVGDGAQRARLDERVRKENVANLVVKGSFPRPDAMAMVAGADVSVIPLRKGIRESIPTKLYDSLSVGCPVIVVAEGEAHKEGTSLGVLCTPAGDAGALADALRELSRLDYDARRALGERGKASMRERADRTGIMEELVGRIAALDRSAS